MVGVLLAGQLADVETEPVGVLHEEVVDAFEHGIHVVARCDFFGLDGEVQHNSRRALAGHAVAEHHEAKSIAQRVVFLRGHFRHHTFEDAFDEPVADVVERVAVGFLVEATHEVVARE